MSADPDRDLSEELHELLEGNTASAVIYVMPTSGTTGPSKLVHGSEAGSCASDLPRAPFET